MKKIITMTLLSSMLMANENYIGLGFGEIPLMDSSFKPSLYAQSYLDESSFLFTHLQAKDNLQRDENSFNIQKANRDDLVYSKETTGERVFIGFGQNIIGKNLSLIGGLLYTGMDTENALFANSTKVSIQRDSKVSFITGLSAKFTIYKNLYFDIAFAMDPMNKPEKPTVSVLSNSQEEKLDLKNKLEKGYVDNFHNRYHIFNIGITYKY